MTTEWCKDGQRLYIKDKGICVTQSGECTSLYYHIQICDECEQLRNVIPDLKNVAGAYERESHETERDSFIDSLPI